LLIILYFLHYNLLTFHCFFASFRLNKRDLLSLNYPIEVRDYILKGCRSCCLGDLLYFFEQDDCYCYLGSRYVQRTRLDVHCFGIMRKVLFGFLFHFDSVEAVNWYIFPKDSNALSYAQEYEFPSYIQFINL
jgi:hypothetical protein